MKEKPAISVVMSVYNGEKFLREAVVSILTQSFTDFEFLIIDDGSNDKTPEIIKSFSDSRIRIIKNKINFGLAASLNKGIRLARGEFIARMDCDDISYPNRFLVQIKYLEEHSDVDVCGSGVELFGDIIGKVIYPHTNELIKCKLLFRNAIAHPSVMIRKNALLKNNFYYNPIFKNSEDYDLWTRSIKKLKFINLPEILIRYRLSRNQQSCNVKEKIHYSSIARENYLNNFNIPITIKEMKLHNDISLGFYKLTKEFIEEAEFWLGKIKKHNETKKVFDHKYLSQTLEEQWFIICNHTTTFGVWSVWKYFNSKLFNLSKDSIKHSLIILLKWGVSKLTI